MKKGIVIFSTLLLSGTLFISSCSKSDNTTTTEQSPVIAFVAKTGFISGDATLAVGAKFKVNITASSNTSSNSKLANFNISRVYQNTPTVVLDTTISQTSLNAEITASALNVAGVEKWIYKITDQAGQSAQISLNITTIPGK